MATQTLPRTHFHIGHVRPFERRADPEKAVHSVILAGWRRMHPCLTIIVWDLTGEKILTQLGASTSGSYPIFFMMTHRALRFTESNALVKSKRLCKGYQFP